MTEAPRPTSLQTALDEARMLVLGVEVLLGFQYRAFFESTFADLPPLLRRWSLVNLGLLLATLATVLLPASRHHIVDRGEDNANVVRFTERAVSAALAVFATALAGEIGFVVAEAFGLGPGVVAATGLAAAAIGTWHLAPWLARALGNRRTPTERNGRAMGATSLDEKIRQVLTEARVVLPGSQALLGFQLAIVMMPTFGHVDGAARAAHFVALAASTITVVLLLFPASFHRVAEGGVATPRLHRLASYAVLAAMAALAVALASDVYVVVETTFLDGGAALAAALVVFLALNAVWIAVPLLLRGHGSRRHDASAARVGLSSEEP